MAARSDGKHAIRIDRPVLKTVGVERSDVGMQFAVMKTCEGRIRTTLCHVYLDKRLTRWKRISLTPTSFG